MIIKMYMINGLPFTFDELPEIAYTDPEIIKLAEKNRDYTAEELFYISFYLIEEAMHPLVYDLDLENPEDLPQDDFYEYDEEDLYS